MEHCAISQYAILKLSFLEVDFAVNHHYIRFLRIAIIPFIRQYQGNGHYCLWIDLESAHYANNTLTVLWQQGTCFALKDANPSCVALLRPVEDFWPSLKKAIYTMIFLKWNRLNWNCSGCVFLKEIMNIASKRLLKTVYATFFTFWVAALWMIAIYGTNTYGNFFFFFSAST